MTKMQKLVLATAVIGSLGSMGCGGRLAGLSVRPVPTVDSMIHYPGDGGVVVSTSRSENKGICVAPPAQAAVTINVQARGRGKQSVSLKELSVSRERELEVGLAETLGRLYEQNEQTLFLQHSLYRLCEAYVNGLFDTVPYSMWLADERIRTERRAQELSELSKLVAARRETRDERKRELDAKRVEIAMAEADPSSQAKAKVLGLRTDLEGLEADLDAAQKELAAAESASAQLPNLKTLADDLKAAQDAAKEREFDMLKLADQPEKNCVVYVSMPTKGKAGKTEVLSSLECRQRILRQLSRTSYMQAVEQVLATAERLSKIDVERHKALAEVAKAEAEKAKAELARVRADATARKNAELLEELRTKTLDSVTKALSRCGEKCSGEGKEKDEKKAE